MEKVLMTGAGGFLGTHLVHRLHDKVEIVAMGRNEGQLVALKEFYPKIQIVVGDVCNPYDVDRAMRGCDGVFHLAAMKHIRLAEENVVTCIKSNVIGTMNILEASVKHKPEFVVGVSTDKAAQVNGVYGATKFLMERLFNEYEGKLRIVRYGNVLYSTGSVLVKWRDKMRRGEKVIITDPNATRFYWTVDEAIQLIFDSLEQDELIFVPKMKSIRLGDLLEAMMNKYGKVEVETIGLQQGENMHERITENGLDSSQTEKYTLEEIEKLI